MTAKRMANERLISYRSLDRPTPVVAEFLAHVAAIEADLAAAKAECERLRQALGEDETDGPPIGWQSEAIGKGGSTLCRSPVGHVRRYNFCEFNGEGTK